QTQGHVLALGMFNIELTIRSALLSLRSKHEVINDQLAFPAEEVAERLLSARSIENIFLLHFLPGQFAAFPAQLIAQTGEFLLLSQEFLACRNPFRLRDNFRMFNRAL